MSMMSRWTAEAGANKLLIGSRASRCHPRNQTTFITSRKTLICSQHNKIFNTKTASLSYTSDTAAMNTVSYFHNHKSNCELTRCADQISLVRHLPSSSFTFRDTICFPRAFQTAHAIPMTTNATTAKSSPHSPQSPIEQLPSALVPASHYSFSPTRPTNISLAMAGAS